MGDIIAERYSRRDLIRGVLAVSAITATVSPMALLADQQARATDNATTPSFNFKEVAAGSDEKYYVAEGYDADVLIRWGDRDQPHRRPLFDLEAAGADPGAAVGRHHGTDHRRHGRFRDPCGAVPAGDRARERGSRSGPGSLVHGLSASPVTWANR